jgi:hypothetical protein
VKTFPCQFFRRFLGLRTGVISSDRRRPATGGVSVGCRLHPDRVVVAPWRLVWRIENGLS